MNLKKHRARIPNVLRIACCLLLTLPAIAQTARPDFNRANDYDVQHYILRISFNRPAKKVIGDTTVRLKPRQEGFRRVTLDSVGIAYSSVTLEQNSTALTFKTQGGSVIVDLDRAYSPSETIGIRFQYTATPRKGIYFVAGQKGGDGFPGRSAQIWTQ